MRKRLGFIGAGNMAEALMRGVMTNGLFTEEDIIASALTKLRRDYVAEALGVETTASNAEVVDSAPIVILAVKPQQLDTVLKQLSDHFTADHLVISIAAGITLKALEKRLPRSKVVRVMPNQPCIVMAGASAFSMGSNTDESDSERVMEILESVGITYPVVENLLDAVTGLSGSGPAYAYLMIESMADGGVLMGLPRDIATKLAAQTLLGAAQTILEAGEHPGRMKDQICSPGGTSIAAIQVLEEAGVRGALIAAVQASAEKSKELGR